MSKHSITERGLLLLSVSFLFSSSASSTSDSTPLEFGFHNMLSNYYSYYNVFKNSLDNNITVHSVEFEWREDDIQGHYYWGRSDSIVIAAHEAMVDASVPIELRARFQLEICAPTWAPTTEPIPVAEFLMIRMRDYEYYSEFLEYLCVFVDRYRPGGTLYTSMNWNDNWGVSHLDMFGELDRMWYPINDAGDHILPYSMHIDEFAALYNEYRTALRSVHSGVSIPVSTLSIPFSEVGLSVPGIGTEDEYTTFVALLKTHIGSSIQTPEIDEFDWHTFILSNDPLNPGIYDPAHPDWPEKSFSERSLLIASFFENTSVPISTFEGASTCYWTQMRNAPEGVRLIPNHRNHIAFQLMTLAEISSGGYTRVLTFDSTIDDGVSASIFPEYRNYEQWWDDAYQPEDSLFLAYSRMATLLSGSYCEAKCEYSINSNQIVVYQYCNTDNQRTYMIRAVRDAETDFMLEVATSEVMIYRLLDVPIIQSCPDGVCFLPDVDWEIVWVRELADSEPIATSQRVIWLESSTPSSGAFRFRLTDDYCNSESVSIYDLTGRKVASAPVVRDVSGLTATLSQPLPSGGYFAVPAGHGGSAVHFTVLR